MQNISHTKTISIVNPQNDDGGKYDKLFFIILFFQGFSLAFLSIFLL